MKTNFLFVFSFLALPVFGQQTDSLAVAREVDSLIQVSDNFTMQGAFDEALEVNAVAEKIALERFGPESAVYGGCCYNRGMVLASQGDNLQAIKWYLEAKTIFGKAFGEEHLHYAFCLNNLGNIYLEMGDYEKAESLYLDSKAIVEKALGKEHPSYGNSLLSLANLYLELGNYEKAKLLLLEAKAILEKALGREHPYYATILNNLANMYMGMGNYEKAELLYFESKSIREKTLGKEHSDYAASLTNLAHLYSDLGNYEKAEPFYLDSKTIREKSLGKDHPDYAYSLSNLAMLYTDMGNYEKALPLHLETLTIQEKNLGKDHPDYVGSLINLAILYYDLGNYEKAETLYLEAKEIFESRIKNLEHPFYMNCLINLAMLYRKTSNYEKAELLNLKVKATWEKNLGKDHPNYAGSLDNLGYLYLGMGDYEKAQPLIDELTHLNQSLITKAMHHLSERELNTYLNKFSESQYLALSYAQLAGGDKSAPNCFNYALFYKGFLLNAAGQIKRLALSDSQTTEKYNLLKSFERRLSAQYALTIAERDSTLVIELEEKANDLEKYLARTVAGFGEALRQVKWQEVQTKLKADELALELVHYRYTDKKQTDSTMYAALVLRPGWESPRFIALFEEKSLDSLLHTTGERKADYVNALYTIAERSTKPLGKPKKSLYELLWKPLEKHLAGVNTVFFSPSGLLHRLNLAAIPIGLDSALADRHHFVELGSTRQLVIPNEYKPAANDAVLFGGIQYDADSTAISRANSTLDSISIASRGELSFSYTDSTLRVGAWSELPFTEREVNNIGRIMKSAGIQPETRRGYIATEEAFKSIGAGKKPSPRVLHLATHGFFFPDPKSATSSERVSGDREPVFKISDHPMIRSGLILSGGNHAWVTGKSAASGLEDGILTAYEISQMNLSNTELVVLSACETGLGDVQGNEGVYGLQRAFKIAGAKYLIMSLWQVPDKQTSLLMTTFYKKWLEEKMAIPEAFRAAQKELREAGLDPYQWAGFVLVE